MPSRRRLIITQEVMVSSITSALVRNESRCALARAIHRASGMCAWFPWLGKIVQFWYGGCEGDRRLSKIRALLMFVRTAIS